MNSLALLIARARSELAIKCGAVASHMRISQPFEQMLLLDLGLDQERAKRLTMFMGMAVIVDRDMPPGEVRLYTQDPILE